MNANTQRLVITGSAGAIDCAIDRPAAGTRLNGLAVLAHPHPLFGGTMDNKVVQTMARAFLALGHEVLRFNFRGVGGTAGVHDEGRGEADDLLAVVAHQRRTDLPLVLGGFSFGAYVTTLAAARLAEQGAPASRLLLVGPSTQRARPAPVPADSVIIHGESDDVVPLSATLDWARPQQLPVIVMPGVGHFFHGQLTQLRELIVRSWR
jgi:alpha/beta superfamily hydrolase